MKTGNRGGVELQICNCIINEKLKNTTLSEHFENPMKIVERGKVDIPNTQIHDMSLSWHGTNTLIKVAELNNFNGPNHPLLVK